MNPTTPNLNPFSLNDLQHAHMTRELAIEEGERLTLSGEIEPYAANVGLPTEPRAAWQDSLSALTPVTVKSLSKVPLPPEWANWVQQAGADPAVAYAAGNFPQEVRDLASLVEADELSTLRPHHHMTEPVQRTAKVWIEQRMESHQPAEQILAIGVLRYLGEVELAEHHLARLEVSLGGEWQSVIANERGAVAWHRGDAVAALQIWSQGDTLPMRFNQGMALLFTDRAAEALPILRKVTEQLPETCGWHHLAGLFTALADMRA